LAPLREIILSPVLFSRKGAKQIPKPPRKAKATDTAPPPESTSIQNPFHGFVIYELGFTI
jgi:hypothetical protein